MVINNRKDHSIKMLHRLSLSHLFQHKQLVPICALKLPLSTGIESLCKPHCVQFHQSQNILVIKGMFWHGDALKMRYLR